MLYGRAMNKNTNPFRSCSAKPELRVPNAWMNLAPHSLRYVVWKKLCPFSSMPSCFAFLSYISLASREWCSFANPFTSDLVGCSISMLTEGYGNSQCCFYSGKKILFSCLHVRYFGHSVRHKIVACC